MDAPKIAVASPAKVEEIHASSTVEASQTLQEQEQRQTVTSSTSVFTVESLSDPFYYFYTVDQLNEWWSNTLLAAEHDHSLPTLALAGRFWLRPGTIDTVQAQSPAFQRAFTDGLASALHVETASVMIVSVRPRDAFYSGTVPSEIISSSRAAVGVEVRIEPDTKHQQLAAIVQTTAAGFSIRMRHALHNLFEQARSEQQEQTSFRQLLSPSQRQRSKLPVLFTWLELVEDPDCRPLIQVLIFMPSSLYHFVLTKETSYAFFFLSTES
jgi:hypothetical protein